MTQLHHCTATRRRRGRAVAQTCIAALRKQVLPTLAIPRGVIVPRPFSTGCERSPARADPTMRGKGTLLFAGCLVWSCLLVYNVEVLPSSKCF